MVAEWLLYSCTSFWWRVTFQRWLEVDKQYSHSGNNAEYWLVKQNNSVSQFVFYLIPISWSQPSAFLDVYPFSTNRVPTLIIHCASGRSPVAYCWLLPLLINWVVVFNFVIISWWHVICLSVFKPMTRYWCVFRYLPARRLSDVWVGLSFPNLMWLTITESSGTVSKNWPSELLQSLFESCHILNPYFQRLRFLLKKI